MTVFGSIRRQRLPATRGVLVLFGAVWLQMALQPCAMAFAPADAGDAHATACPHCPDAERGHCGGDSADRCTFIDGFDYDGRISEPAAPSAPPCATVNRPSVRERQAQHHVRYPDCLHGPPRSGPLYLLHCVLRN